MFANRPHARGRITRLSLALLAVAAALTSVSPSGAVIRPTSFRDSFETLGPLAGNAPSDPYEIKRGIWEVEDLGDILSVGNPRRVLMQKDRLGETKPPPQQSTDPIVFVRDASFRSFTAQVTAALVDNIAGSSLGIVFRAPVLEDQSVDPDNLYLFDAANTGGASGLPSYAFSLWKRVGTGYFMLREKIAPTWADLTRPHDYKVIMTGGHIQAFVDGRLVIEHTDIPSPDVPTRADPFPGLPYHAGSIGLRTSKARAWFDDLVIVADDAYEGRASAIDAFATVPLPADARRGVEVTLTNQLDNLGANVLDTGFVYSDQADAQRSVIKPYEDGRVSLGASLMTRNVEGTAETTARLMRVEASFGDPTDRVSVHLDLARIETFVTASCDETTSEVHFASGKIWLTISNGQGQPDTTIGPFPIDSSYEPNAVIFRMPGVVTISAHRTRATTKPQRVETSALVISFPTATAAVDEINIANSRILPRSSLGTGSYAEVSIANAVAGRYCSPMVEHED